MDSWLYAAALDCTDAGAPMLLTTCSIWGAARRQHMLFKKLIAKVTKRSKKGEQAEGRPPLCVGLGPFPREKGM